MTGRIFGIIVFLSIFIFSSCDGEDNDTTPPVPTKATIKGSVNLFNEGTEQITSAGMKVSVAGTSISSLTNSEGNFELFDVPFGARTLIYEKADYGTYKKFIPDFNGDLIIGEAPSLGKKSKTKVITGSVSFEGTDVIVAFVTEGTNTPKRYMRYFLGTDQTVTKDNYTVVTGIFESDANNNPSRHRFTQQELNDFGFASGTQVFVKAYGESHWGNSYEDTDLNQQIFPNLNENSAESVMFMVP